MTTVTFCRSRSAGRRCTRHLDHAGLHRHRTIMWSDAGADDPHCTGSGAPAEPAAELPGGYPNGRALCDACVRFVGLDDGRLVEHETSDSSESPDERSRRADWLNTHGW